MSTRKPWLHWRRSVTDRQDYPAAKGRRFRLWLGNVPVVSLFSYRWMILQGSVIYDLALTRRAARRRRPNGRAVQVVPVGFPKVWR